MATRTLPKIPDAPKRVAVYLRQSLDSTGEGLAVARQRKDILKLCADRGWVVVATYDDNDKSASGRRKRPGFEAMLIAARNGEFDVIVGWHLDRLTRTLKDYLPLLELAEKHGVAITTVAGDIDLTSDMGQVVAGVLAVVANGEIKRKGARQTRANEQRAEKGLPSIGGHLVFGYADDKVTVVEVEAAVLRDCYAGILAGRSTSSIARQLNDGGHYAHKGTGKPWTRSGVNRLLLNPRYAGLKVYKGEITGQGAWEPVVDESTWRAVAAILRAPGRRTNPNPGGMRRWVGTGLYRCGVCDDGTTMVSGYRDASSPARLYKCRLGAGKHLVRVAERSMTTWRLR